MKKSLTILVGFLLCAFFMNSSQGKPGAEKIQNEQAVTPTVPALKINPEFGKMALYFIPNAGQMDKRVAFYVQGTDKTLYFASDGLTIVLSEPLKPRNGSPKPESGKTMTGTKGEELNKDPGTKSWVVKLDFVGANPSVRPAGEEKTGAAISYFKGKPDQWYTGLPTCSKIIYPDLWPGIDLIYSGSVHQLKYEFIVHPGADPDQIRLRYRGASDVNINDAGQLEVKTPAGSFQDGIPLAYQDEDGRRIPVALSYTLTDPLMMVKNEKKEDSKAVSRSHSYGFQIGNYDRSKPLVLDPAILVYCGYIGGSMEDDGYGIDVDGSGNAYITGLTISTEATFPVTVGPGLTNSGWDAFVAKVNAAGTGLVYCGYIGGSEIDDGAGIAVDNSGCAYVCGRTYSLETTFPVVIGPDLTHNGGWWDLFIAKVNASGTALDYCGYIGGDDDDLGYGIAVDDEGNAYVTGYTLSSATTLPLTVGPDLVRHGDSDVLVAKVNASGTGLDYCGLIGGAGMDRGMAIAVDASGNAYVTGWTTSTQATFPVAVGPTLAHTAYFDGFVAKVNASGTALNYCGYIGGSDNDEGFGIAVDDTGHAYVTGRTASTDGSFPVAVGPDVTHGGGSDVFVAKVKTDGSGFDYCGFIGGTRDKFGNDIVIDSSDHAYVTGYTQSTEASFPVKAGPDLTYNGGYMDAFVAKVNDEGTGLDYCGYIGGSDDDEAYGIAIDSAGNIYVTGFAASPAASFPVTVGPDLTHNGDKDAFVAKITSISRDDLIGTWDGQGVYFRNSDTAKWVKLASPADMIAAGDLDGEGKDDLIGIWPGQGGVWVRYSKTGTWAKLSTTAKYIAAGDMNGDTRADLLGTWDGQGVYYRDSISALWVKLASPATLITAGDLDGDNIGDLIGIWPTQGGVWVKYSKTSLWAKLSTSARDMATGDMNGDGRVDLVGTWDGQGVYYRDSMSGAWVKMSVPGEQISAGDLDGDGTDDLIGLWASQGGVWVKYSKTGAWSKLSSSVKDMAAGLMRGAFWGSSRTGFINLQGPAGGYAAGPRTSSRYKDLTSEGPGGWRFAAQEEKNLIPQATGRVLVLPGPGDAGFVCTEQGNLIPQETAVKEKREKKKEKIGKKNRID